MEIKKNYKSPHEEELTTKTHSFTKNYVGGKMKSEDTISIKTVADIMSNERICPPIEMCTPISVGYIQCNCEKCWEIFLKNKMGLDYVND